MIDASNGTAPEFTAHDIAFADGSSTMGGGGTFDKGPLPQAVARSLAALYPNEAERANVRVADLGCLEGGYTVLAARMGFQAVGIEAREHNIAKCNFVQQQAGLDRLSFVHDDVRNMAKHGPFDVTICLGLLYHLDQPAEFLQTIGSCTSRALILHTHFATPDSLGAESKKTLSKNLVEHEGNLGRWYTEYPPDWSPSDIENKSWAAWGNSRSFWIEKRHLFRSLQQAGFGLLAEQHDFLADQVTDDHITAFNRSMFLAVKV
jgi:SAM-dependent methyltransferase